MDDHSAAGRLLTALFGHNGNPSLVEVLGYVSYWLLASVLLYREVFVSLFWKALSAVTSAS